MPLTFPSHAAAILPFLHLPGTRRLPVSALVIGSTAPDLIYLVGTHGAAAHLPPGLLRFCLPAGLLAFLYLEALVLPVLGPLLASRLPRFARRAGAALLLPRPLPRTFPGWLAVGVAIVLGAATHQGWDSFTHAWMWPARVLYPGVTLSIFGHPLLLTKVLQHTSSLLGALVVVAYVSRGASSRSLVAEVPPEDALPPTRARPLWRFLGVPLLGAFVAGALRLRHPHPIFARALWDAGWTAAACFTLLLGVICLVLRLLQTRSRQN